MPDSTHPLVAAMVAVICEADNGHAMGSRALCAALGRIDPEQWGDLTPEVLADQLRPLGIRPTTHRLRGHGQSKGYSLKDLAPELWERHLARQVRPDLLASPPAEAYLAKVAERFAAAGPGEHTDLLADLLRTLGHDVHVTTRVTTPLADPCGVYAYYDPDGLALYVGITKDDDARHGQHLADKPWIGFTANRVSMGTFSHRADALARERELIDRWHPVFNRTVPGWHSGAVRYLADNNAYDLLAIRGLVGRDDAAAAVAELVRIGATEHVVILGPDGSPWQ